MREMMEECCNVLYEYIQALKRINKTYRDITWHDIWLDGKWRIEGIGAPNWNLTSELYYDRSYGIQHLYGYIVFDDGSYLARRSYDGKEWWEYFKTPEEGKLSKISTIHKWKDNMYIPHDMNMSDDLTSYDN